jgi:hypothetical protein
MIGEIVSTITTVGEIVGRLTEDYDDSFVIENPRAFMMGEGGAGFAPGISVTGEKDPKSVTISKQHVVFLTKASETVEKAWIQQTSGIVI